MFESCTVEWIAGADNLVRVGACCVKWCNLSFKVLLSLTGTACTPPVIHEARCKAVLVACAKHASCFEGSLPQDESHTEAVEVPPAAHV